MTLVAAWIRKVNNAEELVFMSDSRLGGGHRWDECPKLMTMPRSDCALGFAGDTHYAYPMMMQIYNAMTEFEKVRTKSMCITDLTAYVLKHINHLSKAIYDKADPHDIDENEFIFGGYDWRTKSFKIWPITYSTRDQLFRRNYEKKFYHPNFLGQFGAIAIIGDQNKIFTQKLKEVLIRKYGSPTFPYSHTGFDMEPFEALSEMLLDPTHEVTIGGAPQLIKIYQYQTSRILGVYWPFMDINNVYKNRTLLGRKLFEFEEVDYWFLDPKTLRSFPCRRGMNKYINMFNDIKIEYIDSNGDISIKIIPDTTKPYIKFCNFSLKSQTRKYTYGDKFKIYLSFSYEAEQIFNIHPLDDIMTYTIPSKEELLVTERNKFISILSQISHNKNANFNSNL